MKSSCVSIAISVASPGRCSRRGRQKVQTPGPYSTNNFVVFQSTGRSMWRIRVGDDGTTDPTMTGCLMKPRTNMPHGQTTRLSFARTRWGATIFDSWACARGFVLVAFALLRLSYSVAYSAVEPQARSRLHAAPSVHPLSAGSDLGRPPT